MTEFILEMRNITKEFPGVKALNNVSLKVKKGEIHALVGENGAGKSTLMNILSGVYQYGSYNGDIIYNGDVVKFKNIKQSEELGIAIIHQELTLIPFLPIAENIFLGNEVAKGGIINKNETYKRTKQLMEEVNLNEYPSTLIVDISVGKQQLVEICKALSKKVELLILDEPTASLNDIESQNLLNLLLQFKKQGITSIMISHKLQEVMKVADSITIIRDGSVIETMNTQQDIISEDRIISCMVGRSLTDRFPKRNNQVGEVFFEVTNWCVDHPLQINRKICDDISINVRRGEVVGIAGLMGSGRTEFAMSLFGKSYGRNIKGNVIKNGKSINMCSTCAAIKNKVAYVTEDRKEYGLVMINDIKDNITLAALDKFSTMSTINKGYIFKESEKIKGQMNIKTPNVFQKVGNLSGGNQQKVVLGKWIMTDPEILILDEPTRGIDVGAKYEIYLIINELVKSGKGVIIISSELEEVIGMSDRVYVLNEGKIQGELTKEEVTQEAIMRCIVSSKSSKENYNETKQ